MTGKEIYDALQDYLKTQTVPAGSQAEFREAVQLEGTRFSPRLTELLRDGKTAERLRAALEAAEENACRRMYEDALEEEARRDGLQKG